MGKRRLVMGVGINDLPSGAAARGNNTCYTAWSEMLKRCYSSTYQQKNPTYVGCTVADSWLFLSAFRGWVDTQDHQGMALDKDLLFPGNKVYSAETCVFMPQWLNTFLSNLVPRGSVLPMGVSAHGNRFRARYKSDGVLRVIGSFLSIEEAHIAYCRFRLIEIERNLDRYHSLPNPDQRISSALKRLHQAELERVDGLLLP